MALQLQIAAHSEVGLIRKNNQDSGYASPHLLVVADGMGGAAAGDLASAVVVDTIRRVDAHVAGDQMLEVLAGALHKANDRIADLVEEDYALEGMGTTVTGALFDGSQFGLAHIGDSRAYLMHDGRLQQLTHDHSWVQSLVDSGKINEEEAAVHPHRSLLLKVLNGQPANDPDLTLVKVEAGDRLLLCSDGLCGLVDDKVIEQAMRSPELDAALRQLVSEALAEGGIDNITVILADVVEHVLTADTLVGSAATGTVLGAALECAIPPVATRTRPGEPVAADRGNPDSDSDSDSADGLSSSSQRPAATSAASELAEDEARYSPQPPHTRPRSRSLTAAVIAVLVVAAALASAYAWTRTQYYVGATNDRVAIFQGLDESLPGVPLSRLIQVQPLAVSALPPYYQERVRATIDVPSLAAARQTVSELTAAARRCAQGLPKATARPTPSPQPSRSVKPLAPASLRPTVSAGATPPTTPTTTTSTDAATPGPDC